MLPFSRHLNLNEMKIHHENIDEFYKAREREDFSDIINYFILSIKCR